MRINDDYCLVREAAERLGISPATVRLWDSKGKIKSVRHPVNNWRMYLKADVEALADKIFNTGR